MPHGSHNDCLMCSMVKTVGMMEKHPKDCKCGEVHPKKEGKEDEQKSGSKISASLGMS